MRIPPTTRSIGNAITTTRRRRGCSIWIPLGALAVVSSGTIAAATAAAGWQPLPTGRPAKPPIPVRGHQQRRGCCSLHDVVLVVRPHWITTAKLSFARNNNHHHLHERPPWSFSSCSSGFHSSQLVNTKQRFDVFRHLDNIHKDNCNTNMDRIDDEEYVALVSSSNHKLSGGNPGISRCQGETVSPATPQNTATTTVTSTVVAGPVVAAHRGHGRDPEQSESSSSSTTRERRQFSFLQRHHLHPQQQHQEHHQHQQAERQQCDNILYEEMRMPTRAESENHAVYGTWMRQQPGHLEQYRIFRRIPNNVDDDDSNDDDDDDNSSIPLVVAVIRLGDKLNGHIGIVHGGIVALLIDDVLGYASEATSFPTTHNMAMTANLNLNFRRPVLPHTEFLIQAFLLEQVGRKMVFSFRVTSPDNDLLYCEGTSVYVVPREHEASMARVPSRL